jgi:type IV secretory pathway component VirB8
VKTIHLSQVTDKLYKLLCAVTCTNTVMMVVPLLPFHKATPYAMKTDRHDKTEILLKVALTSITHPTIIHQFCLQYVQCLMPDKI